MRNEPRPRIWMHCASLGEWEQGRPVLQALQQSLPHHATVLTFFSPSGYAAAGPDAADHVFYLPFDGRRNAARFLIAVAPAVGVLVKYEVWPGYAAAAARLRVPLVLVCARFRPGKGVLRRGAAALRQVYRSLTGIAVQDAESVAALAACGLQSIETGDARYDRVILRAAGPSRLPYRNPYPSSANVLVAGSTWPADEAVLRRCWNRHAAAYLILAPHETDEATLAAAEKGWGGGVVRWSAWDGHTPPRILMIDRVGFLFDFYRWGTIAFVGGGFARTGIHNVLEPAAHGLPVVFGPNHFAYSEAAGLLGAGGGAVAADPASLLSVLDDWLQNDVARTACGEAARRVVEQGGGAALRTARFILERAGLSSADIFDA